MGTYKKNKELLIEYDSIIREQSNLGIIEHIENDKNKTPEVGAVYYMPHKPVVKADLHLLKYFSDKKIFQ